MVLTYTIFSLCTRDQGIFALVESLQQSQLLEFCVTRSRKIRVLQKPSVGFLSPVSFEIYESNSLKTPSVLARL